MSVVVVNWNGAQDLRDELPSLIRQEYPSFDVVVVDNGSQDASVEVVAGFPSVRWLPLGENRGLAAALNEGAAATTGEFVLFLNNDMRFAPDFLQRLVDALRAAPRAFAADAIQRDWDDARVVHERTRLRRAGPGGDLFAWWATDQATATEPTTCLFASASNLLARRDRFDEIGGWDGAYPIGQEDVDLAWRAWRTGYSTIYVPDAMCWHKVGASGRSEEGNAARLRGSLYGRIRFAVKQLPWWETAWTFIAGVAPLPVELLRRRRVAKARVGVIVRIVREFPELLRARRAILSTGGPSPRSLLEYLARI